MNRLDPFKWTVGLGLNLAIGSVTFAQEVGPVVETAGGPVRAAIVAEVENFFGIPYAAPPVEGLRWRPPEPAVSWTETRDGGRYGSACPQDFGLDSARTENEDCLFLNVQRPEGTDSDERLPVVVFIHGGGWRTGSGNNENLEALVREGRVVGVTMNYRLGTLGNLAHPALTAGSGQSGNYGYLDQQAALRWVQDNIARFGGDPSRVTIGGESAGGGSACAHLAAPSSEGLFGKAFMMSTLCTSVPLDVAEDQGNEIAREIGCGSDDVLACLRSRPVASFLDAATVADRATSGTDFLPLDPWAALEEGRFSQVPILIGAVRDEGRSFLTDWATRSVPTFDREAYESWVAEEFGADSDAVLAVYPYPDEAGRYAGTYLVADLMIQNFVPGEAGLSPCKTSRITETLARQTSVWAYEFAHSTGPGWFEVPGYVWGAGHAVELPYLIPRRGNAANNADAFGNMERDLSGTMIRAFTSFAANGEPVLDDSSLWPRYEGEDGAVLQFSGEGNVVLSRDTMRAAHRCDFWDAMAQ